MAKKPKNENWVFWFLLYVLIWCISRFMKWLTQYPPFSYFWTDRFFHHRNRDLFEYRNRINKLLSEVAGDFDIRAMSIDQYFITITGKFGKVNKTNYKAKTERMAEILAGEDMYLRPAEHGLINVLFHNKNNI